MGQIDERYIAEALEPMHQESAGTSDENKAAMPKRENCFLPTAAHSGGSRCLVICIGAAGIAQWRLHSEEPGPEMAAYDMAELSEEDGIAPQAEDAAADTPDAGENQGAAADRNAAQGRMVNNAEICFAEIYLEVAKANSGEITWRIVNKSDTETVGWGTDYTLERFTENGWEMIENSAAALETQKETQQAEGSQAVAGETKEGTLDLAADGIRLEAGQYRLKKRMPDF